MNKAVRQWPDNITSGSIRYTHAFNYEGFCLVDADHGIPTFGSVSENGVHVFNYPSQTEDIAERLVACWNAFVGVSLDQIAIASQLQSSPATEQKLREVLEPFARYADQLEPDSINWAPDACPVIADPEARDRHITVGDLRLARAALALPSTQEGWREMASAPKDGTPFLARCPILLGHGDSDATPDAEMRVVWWETRGQFTSDRDLGNEHFTHWRPLPPPPLPSGQGKVGRDG